jgi:glycerol-3-phosphate dehydrogenase subunit C
VSTIETHDGVLGDLVRGSLDHCVKCTICETHCPFSNVTPLFPGPKYVGPQAERFRSGEETSPDASVDYCSSCGICTQVCPQGVQIAEINTRAKASLAESEGIPLRNQLIARPTVLGRLGTPVAPLANWTLNNRAMRILAERVLGIARDASLPSFAGRTFQAWAKKHTPPPTATKQIVFFHNCGTNYYEPDMGEKTVAVLEHNGFEVIVPKQDCCGLPLQSNGIFPAARKYATKLARDLAPHARAGRDIVGVSTSCSLMMKREAREILGLEDDPEVRVVSEHMFDICEYLLALHDRGELRTDFEAIDETIAYHAPCQQQGHNIGKPALDLFALIPGLRTVEMHAHCCGIGGTYGLKAEKREISLRVGADLFEQVRDAAPDTVACDSETCRWHIEQNTGVPNVHPVELLYRAYGLG